MSGKPHPTFVNFERKTELGPTSAAKVLGLPYISYAQLRSRMRPLKRCHVLHIEVILLLPPEALQQVIERRING